MSAVLKNVSDLDWQAIYAQQVRDIQASNPLAHAALQNWALWSRELQGVFPALIPPSIWDLAKPGDRTDWVEAPADIERVEQAEVKAERLENRTSADARLGEEIDIRIHALHFPPIWRRVVKATYFTRELPEYQMPREARVGYEGFLVFLDGSLRHLERAMDKDMDK